MACEVRDIGRPLEAEQLFAECAPDFEYGRCSARRTANGVRIRGYYEDGLYQVASPGQVSAGLRRTPWLEWLASDSRDRWWALRVEIVEAYRRSGTFRIAYDVVSIATPIEGV
jgi:hypothetical protein